MNQIYYGELKCQHEPCKNKAYYQLNNKYVCGVHSRNQDRSELPKRSKREQDQIKIGKMNNDLMLIEQYRQLNINNGKRGNLVLSKMYMMKEPEYIEGYYRIFPNFKHQNRKDGFGCMKLSPKYLGPVKHGQPGLPDALNIENLHQSNKCFQQEVDENGNPTQLFYVNRLKFYTDPVPHRHKYRGTEKNKNIPLYSIWIDKNGQEHRLTYIESRQFYCNFYERLASQQEDFKTLKNLLDNGYNLQICGYDANRIEGNEPINILIEKEYLNNGRPFGHEKILYAMLLLEEQDYPWRKYKTFDF